VRHEFTPVTATVLAGEPPPASSMKSRSLPNVSSMRVRDSAATPRTTTPTAMLASVTPSCGLMT